MDAHVPKIPIKAWEGEKGEQDAEDTNDQNKGIEFKEFINNSTLHGVKYVFEDGLKVRR